MAPGSRLTLAVTCLTLVPALCQSPQEPDCFTSGSIVGAVLGTFVSTAIALGLLVLFLWWTYNRRTPTGADGQRKAAAGVESGSGFDNPCFEGHPHTDAADGTKNAEDGRKEVKSTSWTPLRFFGANKNEKKRALDDSFVSEPERVSVQLRGHDFTGLGFNVTGNMRDGIFVKDILNRGPAFESGKIAQGDKILSVTICFRHVVYEDALTILSYASPYDVTMELEKAQRGGVSTLKQRKASSAVSLTASASSSAVAAASVQASASAEGSNERLVHPLYRSQSIDDLSKIGRADTALRADVRIPALSGKLVGGGGLVKSKLLTKGNIEMDLPAVPDVKLKVANPSASLAVDAGDISVAQPEVSLPDPKPSKFSKFGIKVLPDFKFKSSAKSVDLALTELPTGLAVPEVEVNVPKVEIHVPKNVDVAIDMPDGGAAADVRLPSGEVAIAMPEINLPSGSVSVDVPDVDFDINAPIVSLSSDVSAPELKLKGPSIKGPKIDVSLPTSASVEIAAPVLPDVAISQKIPDPEVSVDLHKEVKGGFHLKFPKFGMHKSAKVELPQAEVSATVPTVDVTLPSASLDIDPKMKKDASAKAGFEFKMPKLSVKKKVDVEVKAAQPALDVKVPEVSVGVEVPRAEASLDVHSPTLKAELPAVELPSVSVEAKKPKMGFSLPKWNLGKGDSASKDVELSLEAPSVQVDLPQIGVVVSDDDEAEGGKKKSKFSLKMPKLSKSGKEEIDVNVNLPKISAEVKAEESDDEGGAKKKGKFGLKMPKVPKAEAEVNLSLPKVSAEVSHGDADDDGGKKKSGGGLFHLKMPKMPKAEAEVTVDLPKVSAEISHGDSDDENSGSKKKSGGGLFHLKKPKIPKAEVELNVDLPKVDVELPKVTAEVSHDGSDDEGHEGKKKSGGGFFNIKMPKMPKAEAEVNVDLPKVDIDLPKVSAEVSHDDSDDEGHGAKKKSGGGFFNIKMPKMPKAEAEVNVDLPKVDVELPKVSAEVSHEDSDDEGHGGKKKSGGLFHIKMPKIPKAEAELNVDLPKVNVDLPKVSAEVSHDDSDDEGHEGKKKSGGGFFNIKMPKMPKAEAELNVDLPKVDVDLPKVSAEVSHDDSDDDGHEGKKKSGGGFFNIKMPKMPKAEAEVNVDLPKVNVDLPKVSAEVSHDDSDDEGHEGKKKSGGGFFHIKMPKMPKAEAEVNLDLPKVDVDLPKVGVEVSHDDSDDESHGAKKKSGGGFFHIKMPKMPKAEAEVNIDLPKVDVDLPKVSAEISHDDSDDEGHEGKKKSGGGFFNIKMPKMPKAEAELNVDLPKVDVELPKVSAEISHDDNDDESHGAKKKSGGGFFHIKMPKMPKAEAEVNVDLPKVDVNLPKVSAEVTHDDSDDDGHEGKKKSGGGFFNIKMPKMPKAEAEVNVDLPKVNVDLPKVSAEVSHDDSDDESHGAKKKSGGGFFHIKMPKMPKAEAEVNVDLPKVNVDLPKVSAEVSHDDSDEHAGSKKKSGGGFFNLKMPKMHKGEVDVTLPSVSAELKGDAGVKLPEMPSADIDASLTMPKVDVKLPSGELDLDVSLPKISAGIECKDDDNDDKDGSKKKSSKFGLKMPKLPKGEVDVNVSVPSVSAGIKTDDIKLPKMPEGEIDVDVNLPKVSVDVKQDESDDEGTTTKKKSKFSLKMPKWNKQQTELQLEGIEGRIHMGADVSESIPSGEMRMSDPGSDEEDDGGKKRHKFGIKMPKFGMGKAHVQADVDVPKVSLDASADLEHKSDSKKKSKFGFKMPKIGASVPDVEIHAEAPKVELPKLDVKVDAESSSEDEDAAADGAGKKKKGLHIKLPKFGLPKAHVDIDVPKAEANIDLPKASIELPKVDVELPKAEASIELPEMKPVEASLAVSAPKLSLGLSGDVDGGDEAKLALKLPKVELKKPEMDVDINLGGEAKIKADLPEEGKSGEKKFSLKMPKFGLGFGKHGADIAPPEVDLSASAELPKMEGNLGADVSLKGPEVNIDLPGLRFDKPHVEASAHLSSGESDDEEDGEKKKMRVKLPKFGLSGGADVKGGVAVPGVHVEGDIPHPKVEFDIDSDGDDEDTKKKSGKFEIKLPKFHLKKKAPGVDVHVEKDAGVELGVDVSGAVGHDNDSGDEGHEKKHGKFGIKMPKFGFKKPHVDVEIPTVKDVVSIEGGIEMPKVELEIPKVELEMPKVEVEIPKVELEMPKVDVTVPSVDIDVGDNDNMKAILAATLPEISIGKPKLDLSVGSGALDIEVEEPKFEAKFEAPSVDIEGLSAKSNIDLDIGKINLGRGDIKLEGDVELPALDVPKELDLAVNVDMPKLPSLEIEGAKKKSKFGIDIGKMGFTKPSVDVKVGAAVDVPKPEVALAANVDLPKLDVDVDVDELDEEKKKGGKFSFKMPKFHLGKHHHGDVKLETSIPEVKAGAELSVDPPSLDIEVPSVSVDVHGKDDADSDDEKKDGGKKKSLFGIKMPKFHMNKPQVPGLDVKTDEVGLDIKVAAPTIEASVEGGLPDVSLNKNIDITLPQASVAVNPIELDINAPEVSLEKEGKKKGKFSFKMPKLHMGGKGHMEAEMPSAELNVKVPKPEIDVDVEGIGAEVSLPTLDINVKGEMSDDDDSRDSDKKKGGIFAFKMPKLHAGGKVDVDLPDVKPQIDIEVPKIDVPSVELPEAEIKLDVEAPKTSPFIVKMPEFDLIKPKIDLDLPRVKVDGDDSDDSHSDDDEEGGKKSFSLGFKMPHFSLGGKGAGVAVEAQAPSLAADVELPSAEVSVGGAEVHLPEADVEIKPKKPKFGFKLPSLTHKAHVDVSEPETLSEFRIEPPSVALQVHGEADVDSGDDEPDKKAGHHHKFGIKMPKFHMRQRGPDVHLPQVELKTEEHEDDDDGKELKVEVKKPKFGIKLPAVEFNKPKVEVDLPKADFGLECDLPHVEVHTEGMVEAINYDLNLPRAEVELSAPSLDVEVPSVDVQVGNIEAEVASVKAQLEQLQLEYDIQAAQRKKDDPESQDSDDEKKAKSGFHLGLKMPKFSLGHKEKVGGDPKVEVELPSASVAVKASGDELTSPSLSSLETEPVKLESVGEKSKKFNLGLKMPKFPKAAGVRVEGEAGVDVAEPKSLKVGVKAPKAKDKKKDGESSSDEEDVDDEKNLSAATSSKLMDVEVKLPRVQVYKNVEYHDAEKEHQHESSSDEEDEVKDIKKNIGARFGVKLKKPKMFSSNKVEISGKNEAGSGSSAMQPEWKLPRVDLRRTPKPAEQELSVDVDLELASGELHRMEQLSPSERAEAIRRDSKASAGIRLHSPSYISSMMPSPRSKKSSLEMLDVESSPRLLSVTRLDPTPPIETSATVQPLYGKVELAAPNVEVSVSDVPSSVIMASEAVKIKRGPPTPARRSIVDPNSSIFRVAAPSVTADVTAEITSPALTSGEVTITADIPEIPEMKPIESVYVSGHQPQQASDTDISVTTSTGSDTLVISCSNQSASSQPEAPNRKASSLGDLTRIPPSGSEDGSLERTVSLDFKPVTTLSGGSSRAIYNLAVQDLSRVGEDSDEDYSLNRKRPNYDDLDVDAPAVDEPAAQRSPPPYPPRTIYTNRTVLAVDTDGDDINMRPVDETGAESLWFDSTSIPTEDNSQANMSFNQLEESVSTDVTLTTTSLGTSPSESSSSSDGSPTSPASPEPSSDNSPELVQSGHHDENGSSQHYRPEQVLEISPEELEVTSRPTVTVEMTPSSEEPQPQPLTDLNPSAGNFAAVRNRFEQLSSTLNGAEMTGSPARSFIRPSPGPTVKRLSGNFEDPVQKSFVPHMTPELSEGAISRTVIISSLQLERSEQHASTNPTSVGPESPVPNLEPPC